MFTSISGPESRGFLERTLQKEGVSIPDMMRAALELGADVLDDDCARDAYEACFDEYAEAFAKNGMDASMQTVVSLVRDDLSILSL